MNPAFVYANRKMQDVSRWLIGDRRFFSLENRIFNLACLFTQGILLCYWVMNQAALLNKNTMILELAFVMECVFYYLSRWKGQFRVVVFVNGLLSYLFLVISYFYEGGINSITLFIFFFTFHVLIATTANRVHVYWIALHLLTAGCLLLNEYYRPGIISSYYAHRSERFIDVFFGYFCTILFIYYVTRCLRRHYLKERIKVQQSEIKLKAIFESSSTCYMLLGPQFELLYYNKACKMFVTHADALQQDADARTLVHRRYVDQFTEHCNRALAGIASKEERLLQYDAGYGIWWNFSFEPARNEENKIIGVSVTITNISDQKEKEEKLQRNQERFTKIAFMQSHELRKPVVSILGLMHIIREEGYAPNKEYLALMETAVNELDGMIREIVHQSRSEH